MITKYGNQIIAATKTCKTIFNLSLGVISFPSLISLNIIIGAQTQKKASPQIP
jgi:hypothetical protein